MAATPDRIALLTERYARAHEKYLKWPQTTIARQNLVDRALALADAMAGIERLCVHQHNPPIADCPLCYGDDKPFAFLFLVDGGLRG